MASAVQRATRRLGLELTPDPFPEQLSFEYRSDQYSFVKQGVPAVFAGEGLKTVDPALDGRKIFDAWQALRYHQPSDDLNQPWNFAAAVKDTGSNSSSDTFSHPIETGHAGIPETFLGTGFGRKQ